LLEHYQENEDLVPGHKKAPLLGLGWRGVKIRGAFKTNVLCKNIIPYILQASAGSKKAYRLERLNILPQC